MDKMISLAEYARRQGRRPDVARHMAERGGVATARKIGRDWVIREDDVWPDRRVTHGRYRDKYARIRAEYAARKSDNHDREE